MKETLPLMKEDEVLAPLDETLLSVLEGPEDVVHKEKEVETKHRIVDTNLIPQEIRDGVRAGEYDRRLIEQGYLKFNYKGEKRRIRIRKSSYPDDLNRSIAYEVAKKRKIKGSETARHEREVEIDKEQFDAYWEFTKAQRIYKTRHYIPYEHKGEEMTIELDIFGGELKGLILVEAEFPVNGTNSLEDAEKRADAFRKSPPEWFGRDVTGEKDWKNSKLAANGVPKEE